jgi:hypothetical protein
LTAKVAEFESQRAAAEVAERLAKRLAELPEAFVDAHKQRADDVRAEIETKWAALDDAAWDKYKTEELLFGFTGRTKVGFVLRSNKEGALPGGDAENSMQSRIIRLKK